MRSRLQELRKALWPVREKGDRGYVLLLALLMALSLFVGLGGILELSLNNLSSAKRTMFDTEALNAAEAGIDHAVLQLTNNNGSYDGTSTAGTCPSSSMNNPQTVFSDSVKGKGTFTTCVTAGSVSHEYIVYSWGKVYRTASDANPFSTRKLKVTVQGSPAGSYAVQTGPGGLIMTNSASITQGPIYIGGYLNMSNTASIGTSSIPIAVNVANARCNNGGNTSGSPYTGYPQICNAGVNTNPITLGSVQNVIYGTVYANDQTNLYATQATNTGIHNSSSVSAPTLPGYDRPAQISAVAGSPINSSSICAGHTSTYTVPANSRINGDLTLTNSCTVTIMGNVWLTGSLTLRNGSSIVVDNSVTTQPTFMVDGSTGVSLQQTSSIVPNNSLVGVEFITFYAGASVTCTVAQTAPAYCDTTLTGSNLFNAQTLPTVTINNSGNAKYSVFYAKYSEADVSQKGTLGAILGQTINLAQSGNLVFTSTVVTGNYSYDAGYYQQTSWP